MSSGKNTKTQSTPKKDKSSARIIELGQATGTILKNPKPFYEKALEMQTDTFFVFDLSTGRALHWNKAFSELSGYTDAEISRLPAPDNYYDEDGLGKLTVAIETLAGQGVATVETDLVCKDKRRIPFEYRISVIMDEQGLPAKVIFIGRDLAERKRAYQNLLESEERYRNLINNIPTVVWISDRSGNTSFISSNVTEVYGYSPDEIYIAGSDLRFGRIHPDDKKKVTRTFSDFLEKDTPFDVEYRIQRKDGQWIWINDRAIIIRGDGDKTQIFGVFNDINDRKKAEEALKVAMSRIQRMKAKTDAENVYLREELSAHQAHGNLVTESRAMKQVMDMVHQVANTDSTVLLLGETGTGKEMIARMIHNSSARNGGQLIIVNCAALPGNLVESELFGREKGAFTGAVTTQIGRFEVADGSTIFLDEIGELPREIQVKLLRVLQEGTFERLGSSKTRSVNVRVIAATNLDLVEEIKEERFRQDLYYRLNVFPISVPPLRDRIEDISLLAWIFVSELAEKMGKNIDGISRQSIQKLQSYSWPGNVRELKNIIERAMIMNADSNLKISIPRAPGSKPEKMQLLKLEDIEKNHITSVLKQTGWRVRGANGASDILGLNPSTLESRMIRLGIRRPGKTP